jgi:hypothetical protein
MWEVVGTLRGRAYWEEVTFLWWAISKVVLTRP